MLEPAGDRSGLTTMAQAVLPRKWEGNNPAASRHGPKNLWSGFHTPDAGVSLAVLLRVSVACLSLHFLELLSPQLPP